MRGLVQSHDPKKAARVTEGRDLSADLDLHRIPSTTKFSIRAIQAEAARETPIEIVVADYSVPIEGSADPVPVTVWRGTLGDLKTTLGAYHVGDLVRTTERLDAITRHGNAAPPIVAGAVGAVEAVEITETAEGTTVRLEIVFTDRQDGTERIAILVDPIEVRPATKQDLDDWNDRLEAIRESIAEGVLRND